MTIAMTALRVACWSGPVSADLAANAAAIHAAIDAAAAQQAQILLTSECVLTGYPPITGAWSGSWCAVAEHEDQLSLHAQQRGLALALGSAEHAHESISNVLQWCGAVRAPTRYRKRALTAADQRFFAAGSTPCVVTHGAWRIGLTICFDVRSAALWHALARATSLGLGADAVLCAAHMAGGDPDPGTKACVVPQFFAVRAAELATPVALANADAPDRWLDSAAWDARGMAMTPRIDQGALRVFDLQHRSAFDPWYGSIRALNA